MPGWVALKMKRLENHRENLEDIKQDISMLIEKIIVIQKVVKKIEEQKKKEQGVIKKFVI